MVGDQTQSKCSCHGERDDGFQKSYQTMPLETLIDRIISSRVLPCSQYKCDCFCSHYLNCQCKMQSTFGALSMLTPTASCQLQVKGLQVTLPTWGEAMVNAFLLLKAGLCSLLPRDIAAVTVSRTALQMCVPQPCYLVTSPMDVAHGPLSTFDYLVFFFQVTMLSQYIKVLKTEQYKEALF